MTDLHPLALAAIAAAVLVLVAARMRAGWAPLFDDRSPPEPVQLDDGTQEQGQGAGFDVGAFMATFDPLTYLPGSMPDSAAAGNLQAFLAMIRKAEGTAGPNGYRTLFGGDLFDDVTDHPHLAKRFQNRAGQWLWTTAAGAYQFMAASPLPDGGSTKVDTWGTLQRRLGLPDFGPESQDAAAVELIREAGALDLVREGQFDEAVSKVRRIWASMPGAGYAQPEKSLTALRTAFVDAGGTLA